MLTKISTSFPQKCIDVLLSLLLLGFWPFLWKFKRVVALFKDQKKAELIQWFRLKNATIDSLVTYFSPSLRDNLALSSVLIGQRLARHIL